MTQPKHTSLAVRYRGQRVGLVCAICHTKYVTTATRADRIKTCGPGCRAIYRKLTGGSFGGKRHTSGTKEKMQAAHDARRTTVVCGCGCGTEFRVPPHRLSRSKTGRIYLNYDHWKAVAHGENSPTWRGGGTFRYGPGWDAIKAEIRARDRVCQQCGKTPEENGQSLDVHHVIPFRIIGDNRPSNLIALCTSCHRRIKSDRVTTRIPTVQHRCIECGRLFDPQTFWQRTCGSDCRQKRRRRLNAQAERRRQQAKRQHRSNPPATERSA